MSETISFREGKSYTLDNYGFLDPPEQWDEEFAAGMAREQGIHQPLTEDHWRFIAYIRRKFLEEETLPLLVMACADNRLRLDRLRSLFPTGYFRGACRIAGVSYAFLCAVSIWHTYENVPHIWSEYRISPQGFLEDAEQWNERFARRLSEDWALPEGLTPKHWEVIRFLRAYYRDTHNIPTVYETCHAHGLDLDELKAMFPGGYRRGACRIAGLPFFA